MSRKRAKSPIRTSKAPAKAFVAVATGPTPTRDPRLPASGTLLQKLDRHGAVRCECTVEQDGIRYAGAIYLSLSAAAVAAAKDPGLSNKTQNGYAFWRLSKPSRASTDPLATLGRLWQRYQGGAEGVVKNATDANRSAIAAEIDKHTKAIESLRRQVA